MKLQNRFVRAIPSLTLLLLMLVAFSFSPAYADTSGPNDAGAGASVAGTGTTIAWLNPDYITTPGTPYATVHVSVGKSISDYLQATQYGFAIPTDSVINGITVVINRMAEKTNPIIADNEVRLVKDGAIIGDNKAAATTWPTTFATATYGSQTDLWGTTWSAAEINAANFGLDLSVILESGGSNTATVDYIQISVNYTISSTTSVDCGSGTPQVVYGSSITCMATVTRLLGTDTPGGTVSWATDGSGSFDTSPCTLSGSGETATCSVIYTPSAVGTGSHVITATYSGDAHFTASSGNQAVTVDKATPSATLAVTNSPVVYTGSPQSATVIVSDSSTPGTVSNILYDGSAVEPTDAATYAVTADFVPDDTANYNSLTGLSAGEFVIAAGPALTLEKTPSPTTFAKAGDVIHYTYLLTNSGDVTLTGAFTVMDDKVSVTCPGTASLVPTASITCGADYIITLDDVSAGFVTNTATGSGFFGLDTILSNSVQATINSYRLFIPIVAR